MNKRERELWQVWILEMWTCEEDTLFPSRTPPPPMIHAPANKEKYSLIQLMEGRSAPNAACARGRECVGRGSLDWSLDIVQEILERMGKEGKDIRCVIVIPMVFRTE